MGRYESSSSKKKNSLVIPMVILCILVIFLLGLVVFLWTQLNHYMEVSSQIAGSQNISGESGVNDQVQQNPSVPDSTEQTQSTEPVVQDVEIYLDDDLCVPTKYVVLHMPEQWYDSIRVEHTQKAGSDTYTFYGLVNGLPEMGLFQIHFNEDGDIFLGSLQTASGDVYINLTPVQLEFDGRWTADEIDLICAMQESTNYMQEKLSEESGFSGNR